MFVCWSMRGAGESAFVSPHRKSSGYLSIGSICSLFADTRKLHQFFRTHFPCMCVFMCNHCCTRQQAVLLWCFQLPMDPSTLSLRTACIRALLAPATSSMTDAYVYDEGCDPPMPLRDRAAMIRYGMDGWSDERGIPHLPQGHRWDARRRHLRRAPRVGAVPPVQRLCVAARQGVDTGRAASLRRHRRTIVRSDSLPRSSDHGISLGLTMLFPHFPACLAARMTRSSWRCGTTRRCFC